MENFKLYKSEKLCSHTAIDDMFAHGQSIIAYPLRAVFMSGAERGDAPARFFISIPKKKVHRAVRRVLMRRRTREAYRLNRQLLLPSLIENGKSVDVAFIYLSTSLSDYATIEERMRSILSKMATAIHNHE